MTEEMQFSTTLRHSSFKISKRTCKKHWRMNPGLLDINVNKILKISKLINNRLAQIMRTGEILIKFKCLMLRKGISNQKI